MRLSRASLLYSLLYSASLFALDAGAGEPESPLPPDAVKLLAILEKRPFSEAVFDRFEDSCLRSAGKAELENFLSSKAEAKGSDAPLFAALLALHYAKNGEDSKALDAISKAVALKPDWPEALFAKARILASLGRYAEAAAQFEAAAKLAKDDELRLKIGKALGKAYAKDAKPEKAVQVWRACVKDSPADFELAEDVVDLEMEEGLLDAAESDCSALLKRVDGEYKRAVLTLRLGDIHMRKGERAKAVDVYASALEKVGSGSWLEKETLSQIERAFRGEDNLTELLKRLSELSAKEPGRLELIRRKAALQLETGDSRGAVDSLRALVKASPDDKGNKLLLADALEKSGSLKDALDVVSSLHSSNPSDPELSLRKAALDFALKRDDACVADLEDYLVRAKKSEAAYARAARLLSSYGLDAEAGKFYAAMAAAYPASFDALEARASFLAAKKRPQEAVALLSKAAEKASLDELLRVSRALVLMKEAKTAFSLLRAREGEFKRSFRYLEELSALSASLGRKDMAFELAGALMNSASGQAELARAVAVSASILKAAGVQDEIRKELELKKDKSEADCLLLAGLVLRAEGPQKALEILNAALKTAPDSFPLLSETLRLLGQRGDVDGSIAILRSIYERMPAKSEWAARELSSVCLNAGRYDAAIEWARAWRRKAPGLSAPYLAESAALQGKGDCKGSTELLRSAWRKFPDDREIPRLMVRNLSSAGDYSRALELWWALLDKEADLAGRLAIVREMAQLAMAGGSFDPLISKFRTRMENDPKSVFPPLALAELFRYNGAYEERRNLLLKVAGMKGDDPAMLAEVARIEEGEGDYRKAVSTLERAVAVDKTPASKRQLANLLMRLGEEERASKLLFEISGGLQTPPDQVAAIALEFISGGDSAKALDFLKPFLAEKPADPYLNIVRAIALEDSEANAAALEAWLKILDVKPEDFSKSAQSPSTSGQGVFQGRRDISPEMVELFAIQHGVYSAYLYKRMRNNYSHFGVGPFGASPSSLPPWFPKDVQALKPFVFAHLGKLSTDLSKADSDALLERLSMKGVEFPELNLALARSSNGSRSKELLDLVDKLRAAHPDDRKLVWLWLSVATSFPQGGKAGDFEDIFKRFKDSDPTLAMRAFLVCAQSPNPSWVPSDAAFDEFLKLVEAEYSKTSDIAIIFPLAVMLESSARGKGLPDERRKILLDKLFSICMAPGSNAGGSGNPLVAAQLRAFLANSSLRLGEYGKYMKMVTLDFVDQPNSAFFGNPLYSGRSGGRNMADSLLRSGLEFPPQYLKGMPQGRLAHFAPLFSKTGANNALSAVHFFGGAPFEIDKGKLWEQAKDFHDPLGRLLLAAACEKDSEADAIAKSFLSAKDSDFTRLVFAASWFASRKDFATAAKALEAAAAKASGKEESSVVGFLTVALAEKSPSTPALVEKANAASKALLALGVSDPEKASLARCLDRLGLAAEAEAIDRLLLQAQKLRSASSAVSSKGAHAFRTSSQEPDALIREALKKGDSDAAVDIALKEYRRLVRLLNAPATFMSEQYKARNLVEVLKTQKVADKFLAELQRSAGDEASPVNLFEAAYACEILKRNDDAVKLYRRLIELDPRAKMASFRLAMLIGESEPDAALKLLKATKLPTEELFQLVSNSVFSGSGDAARVGCAPFCFMILESGLFAKDDGLGFQRGLDRQLAENLFQRLGSEGFEDGESIPSIFAKDAAPPKKEANVKLRAKKEELYLKLCDVCDGIPSTCELAFSRRRAFLKSKGVAPDDALYERAKELLRKSSGSLFSAIVVYDNFGVGDGAPLEALDEFAVLYAATHGKLDDLKAFAKTLPEAPRDQFGRLGVQRSLKFKLDVADALFSASPKDFLAVLDARLSSPEAGSQLQFGFDLRDAVLGLAVGAIAARDLKDVSLTPAFVKIFKTAEPLSQNSLLLGHDGGSAPSKWAAHLVAKGDDEAFKLFLRESVNALFAPWLEGKLALADDSSGLQPYQQMNIISRELSGAVSAKPSSMFPALAALTAPEYAKLASMFRHSGAYNILEQALNSGRGLSPALLKDSPFVKDFPDFSVCRKPAPGARSFFEEMLSRLRHDKAARASVFKGLGLDSTEPPRTFGLRLTKALLTAKNAKQVFDFLAGELPQLKSASPERREELFVCVDSLLREWRLPPADSLDPVLAAMRDEALNASLSDAFEKFKTREISNGNSWEYSDEARKLVSSLAASAPEKAAQVLSIAVKKLRSEETRRNASNNSFHSRRPGSSEISEDVMNLMNSLLHSERPDAARLLAIEPLVLDFKDENLQREFINAWRRLFTSLENEGVPRNVRGDANSRRAAEIKKENAFVNAVETFAKHFDGHPRPPMLCAVASSLDGFSNSGLIYGEKSGVPLARVAKRLAELSAAKPESGVLQEVAGAAEFFKARNERGHGSRPTVPQPFYAGYFADPKVPDVFKLELFSVGIFKLSDKTAAEEALASALRLLERKRPPSSQILTLALECALDSELPKETLSKIAPRLVKAWLDCLNSGVCPPSENMSLNMLKLALRSDDDSLTSSILSNERTRLSSIPAVAILLLNSGKALMAKDFLEKSWAGIDPSSPLRERPTPEGLALLDSVSSGLSSPGLRLFAKALASLSASSDPKFKDSENLAELFKKTEFKDTSLRLAVLGLLFKNSNWTLAMRERLVDVLGPVSAQELVQPSFEKRKELYSAYLARLLDDGRFDDFLTRVRDLAALKSERVHALFDYPFLRAFSFWLTHADGNGPSSKRAQLKPCLEIARILILDRLPVSYGAPGRDGVAGMLLLLALDCAAGEEASFPDLSKFAELLGSYRVSSCNANSLAYALSLCAPDGVAPGEFAANVLCRMAFSKELKSVFPKEEPKLFDAFKAALLEAAFSKLPDLESLSRIAKPAAEADRALFEKAVGKVVKSMLERHFIKRGETRARFSDEEFATRLIDAMLLMRKISGDGVDSLPAFFESMRVARQERSACERALELLKSRSSELDPLSAEIIASYLKTRLLIFGGLSAERVAKLASEIDGQLAAMAESPDLLPAEKLDLFVYILEYFHSREALFPASLKYVGLLLNAPRHSSSGALIVSSRISSLLFNLSKLPDSPEWRTAAASLLTFALPSDGGKGKNRGLSDDDVANALILAARLKNSSAIEELFKKGRGKADLAASVQVAALLLDYGNDVLAAKVFLKKGRFDSVGGIPLSAPTKESFESMDKAASSMASERAFAFKLALLEYWRRSDANLDVQAKALEASLATMELSDAAMRDAYLARIAKLYAKKSTIILHPDMKGR